MKTLIFVLSLLFAQASFAQIIFPRAFAFAVDDLGWNIGNDDGDIDGIGPYRIGLNRKMRLQDYKGIVEVGEEVGVRVQCLFIMGEMDRENILRKYPTTTRDGANWDNTKNVSDEQIDIMNYVREQAAYMEFGLHGVGHEYWVDGVKKRAEWYCQQEDHPWPEKTVRDHIQCFKDIMGQYGLSEADGHSFPESFVPCAYGYYWNPGEAYSTGKVMSDNGVKYVNTLFDYIRELNPPKEANGGGFDNGVVVINRINYGNEWYQLDARPTEPLADQETDIIETHWTNWLAQDDFLQDDVNTKFKEYYKMVQQSPDRYLAKNTEQLHAQWLYNKYTKVKEKRKKVKIDNRSMPDEAYQNDILGTMVLKIKLEKNQHITSATLDKKPTNVFFEEEGYGFIYLPQLAQKKYTLKYKLGAESKEPNIFLSGTYNVYDFKVKKHKASAKVRVYGKQEIVFRQIPATNKIKTDNKNLKILTSSYDAVNRNLTVTVQALDIQGETGTISVRF